MDYCPVNSFPPIWINHGISKCFLDTTTIIIAFIFLAIFETLSILNYFKSRSVRICKEWRYSTSVLWYITQLTLTILLVVISVIEILIKWIYFQNIIYGYEILSTALSIVMWLSTLLMIIIERRYIILNISSANNRKHSWCLVVFWCWMLVKDSLYLVSWNSSDYWFSLSSTSNKLYFGFFVCRYIFELTLFIIGLKAPGITLQHNLIESQTLIQNQDTEVLDNSGDSPFKNFHQKLKVVFPFIWPKHSVWLQVVVVVCVFLLAIGRVINIYVPIYSKKIVDSITPNGQQLDFRWDLVVTFVILKLFQGILGNIRNFLWIKVQQYTEKEVQVKFFAHLHALSMRWHLQRKTGEVLRAVDRGCESMNNILNYLVFNVLPSLADFIIAVVYLTSTFSIWFGLIVFFTIIIFLAVTIYLTEWRTKYRRLMNKADNEVRAQAVDSLLNFETVKYFATEDYEVDKYSKSILVYQVEEWKASASVCLLNFSQNVIINAGLLSGSLLCISMVVKGEGLTVGDYVLFASYINQLYNPLQQFGSYYRILQKSLVDMENMLDLLKEEPEVKDSDYATQLVVKEAEVRFENVSFKYTPERSILKNVSFVVPPGKTVAFVGPSGSGKTTILRLLYRFYDVTSGSIQFDRQDVRDVTQKSLRMALGIVPQDTVLYNNSIKYNINYGRVDANEDDVIRSAKFAEIHDRVATLPSGYDTQVGERGLKLSGGEKQRVAIARLLIKSPSFIVMDEATSALDTHTEKTIQNTLNKVIANCSTIMVAHRLSTIVHADQIYVLDEGEIVENGSFSESPELFLSTIKLSTLATLLVFEILSSKNKKNGCPQTEAETEAKGSKISSLRNLYSKLKLVLPYMWPVGNIKVKLFVVASITMIVIGRVLNLFTPIFRKNIADSMTPQKNSNIPFEFRWDLITIATLLEFLNVLVRRLQHLFWVKVETNVGKEIEVLTFSHVHNLSLRWHINKKSGDVLKSMYRGAFSMRNILDFVVIELLPSIADLLIAMGYFAVVFDWWFSCIIGITIVVYSYVTAKMSDWTSDLKRQLNAKENDFYSKTVDSLFNFETVKYFTNEEHEVDDFKKRITEQHKEDWKHILIYSFSSFLQSSVSQMGLLTGSLLSAYIVVYGDDLTYGDYILFTSYITNLYKPMTDFINQYSHLQTSFVDMESMLNLLNEESEIKEDKDAKDLDLTKGEIVFKNVTFNYVPERVTVKNISFTLPSGKTIAFVGPTGSGKSTILRLIYRFYDVTSGNILINGEDVRKVTIKSLRSALGIVPQDIALYNRSVRYNIKYGKMNATDEEIAEAAKQAEIHDTIIAFPNGYKSKVGERGLKLSGGEKQRIAIARLILRSPKFILMDEATSALDTHTERKIQSTLQKVISNRSTIIVAHRLSTIVHAHQIYVVKDGEIVENGTHEELVSKEGIYTQMWNQQAKKDADSDTEEVTSEIIA